MSWARRAAPATIALGSAIAAVSIGRWLFPAFSPDHDEPVYVFQAEMLGHGHVTLPAWQEHFFRPWLAGRSGDRLVLVFQPVWPAVLALSHVVTGAFWPAKAVIAALSITLVFAFVRELAADRTVALAAAAVVAASPLFLVLSSTYLAYALSLTVLLAFGTVVLRAGRVGSLRLFTAAGACLGLLVFTRPLDALLAGVVAAGWLTVANRRDPRRLGRIAGTVVLGLAPGVTACLLYNAHVTGHPLQFALQAAGGDNAFGFGPRQIAEGTTPVPFGLGDSLWAMQQTLRRVPAWSFGHVLSLPLAAFGAWRLRRRSIALVPLGLVVVLWPLANLVYWGNLLIARGRDYLGPLYYLPPLAAVAVLSGAGLVELARRDRRLGSAVVALMVVATAVGIAMPVRRNLDDTRARRADERAVASATRGERAMVILPRVPDGGWIMHPRPNLRNDPRLQQRVLYAIDNGPDNLQLAASYPDRPLYRFTPRMVPDPNVIFGLMPATEVTRLAVVRGVEVRVPWRIRNHGDGAVVTVYLNDSHRVTVAVIDDQSTKGREYHGAWIIRGDGTITLDPPALHVLTQNFAPPLGRGTLRVGASVGDLPDPTSTAVWEVRYWFDGDGREAAFLAPGEQWLRRATAGTPFLPADTAPVFCVGPPSVSTASQSGELPAGC